MEPIKLILEKLDYLEQLIISNNKEILSVEELEKYTGFKKSYIYHLVHFSKIPYSKPNGKYLFFEKSEIDEWLLKNKSLSDDQLQEKAREYVLKKRNI
ncbi:MULTISPECIES: helix-turn-helix transcriptional regulator [Myroides]|uniref:Helix-turn-helix domain-containing protein n=1 Tax=Myroides pelagicus TaxID=270914 RepID=A0A7K1GNJ8_9FLAO|nr:MULTISPECIES: helix-turn-helix domain-containing protein [Myroides]MDM1353277.1 helix-turn-helix domain-containing protein [Myroides marinus]MDM1461195.1 helix-turn-helix domain-containing protein [Myroides odoratimimus]MEC4084660.1 helix-turn-helix domain-containing protein [Myroides odoratimimus]MTH30310.1 helix-turn-helix domain-containing protein [Myroides pelagicus]